MHPESGKAGRRQSAEPFCRQTGVISGGWRIMAQDEARNFRCVRKKCDIRRFRSLWHVRHRG